MSEANRTLGKCRGENGRRKRLTSASCSPSGRGFVSSRFLGFRLRLYPRLYRSVAVGDKNFTSYEDYRSECHYPFVLDFAFFTSPHLGTSSRHRDEPYL